MFAVSDVVWQTLIQAAAATVLALGLAWIARQAKASADRAAEEAVKAAAKAEEVKVTQAESEAECKRAESAAAEKMDGLAKVARATHELVNSKMAVQLMMTAGLARWKADQTGAAADAEAAAAAEALLRDHEQKQS